MLIIREAQMAALRDAADRRFVQEMAVHLEDFGAPSLAVLDQPQLLAAARGGLVQARQHGFTLRGPIRLYLEAMVVLGHRFQDDPQYPAITAILADPGYGSEMDRAQALFDAMLDYRERVVGDDQVYLYAALEGVGSMSGSPATLEQTPDDLVDMLWYVYPEKALYVGVDVLRALIREGLGLIRALGIDQAQNAVVTCTLMMIFGHGCFDDPFLPWIGQAVAGGTDTAGSLRGRLLHEQTQARVKQMRANGRQTRG